MRIAITIVMTMTTVFGIGCDSQQDSLTQISGVTTVVVRENTSANVLTISDPSEVKAFVDESNALRNKLWVKHNVKHGCFIRVEYRRGIEIQSTFVLYPDKVYELQHGHPHPNIGLSQNDLSLIRSKIRQLGFTDPCAPKSNLSIEQASSKQLKP